MFSHRAPEGSLLQLVAGAKCHFITPEQWDDRDTILADAAVAHGSAWVIPEGASDALGALGFVAAIEDVAPQIDALGIDQPILWHAASSAGTTAGMVRGAGKLGLEAEIVGSSVGDPTDVVEHRIRRLLDEADTQYGRVESAVPWKITDRYIGLGYGRSTTAELAAQSRATQLTGMLFDPAYTGKALYGLREEIRFGRMGSDRNVIFWHTGGGFAVFAHPELVE